MTDTIPKAMAPYDGTTLIREVIGRLSGYVGQVHVTVGHKGGMLAEHLIESNVTSLFNTTGHGNAWWLSHTPLSLVDEPVLVMTCDIIVDFDFASLAEEYRRCGEPAGMIVPVRPVAGRDGDYLFLRGNIIVDISRRRTSEIYCSGIQLLNPARINRLTANADDFRAVWQQLMPLGQLLASTVMPRNWLAFDTMGHLAESEEPAGIRAAGVAAHKRPGASPG